MLAGTLQDYHRALIVGSPTFGKATAQLVLPLDTLFDRNPEGMNPDGNFIKITVQRLFRVNGSSAQETGVIPDIPLRDFTVTRPEREKTLPFALPASAISPNKYYQPYPPLPLDNLKAYARSYTDTCLYIRHFNQYLDRLLALQKPKDEELSLQKVRAEQEQLNEFLASGDSSVKAISLPYEIRWNAFEKARMRTDEDLRNTNQQLSSVLSGDPGLLMGYQMACRMLRNNDIH
jgi:carboxyl-terminal processing protease